MKECQKRHVVVLQNRTPEEIPLSTGLCKHLLHHFQIIIKSIQIVIVIKHTCKTRYHLIKEEEEEEEIIKRKFFNSMMIFFFSVVHFYTAIFNILTRPVGPMSWQNLVVVEFFFFSVHFEP